MLALFVVVAAVSTLLLNLEVSGIVTKLGHSYVVERAMREQARVGDLLEREGEISLRLASSPILRRWMENPGDSDLRASAFRELASFKRAFRDSNYFAVVGKSRTYYNQPDTGPLATTTLDPEVPADIWYFNTVKANRDISYNLDYNQLIGATKVWINCIVRSADGSVIGLAGTGLDITDVIGSLVGRGGADPSVRAGGGDAAGDPASAVSMLIDANGAITAHPDSAYMEHNAKIWTSGTKITVFDLVERKSDRARLEKLVAEAKSGTMGVAQVDIQGHSALTAVAPIPMLDWMTVVSVNTASVISASDFLPLFVVLVVSILLVLTIIAALMDRMVLRPLSAMTESARQVAAGNYDILLPFARRDEIGLLAGAFNRMTVQVKQHTGNLEQLVSRRTGELTEANEKLASANDQVMESIRYARLIQNGVMPSKAALQERLAEVSLFHRQRDVVGGDFLYLRDTNGGFLLGVVDCEGHGVPGALMTMMADSYLQLISSRCQPDDPASVISELDALIRLTSTHSGLSIGLCACLPDQNVLVYAGAAMPLYVLGSDGTIETVPGRSKSAGYRHGTSPGPVTNERIDAEGRTFFLLTDGFVDQAGPTTSRRAYGTTRLRRLLEGTRGIRLDAPAPDWEREFDAYRGGISQRDDVLAIAFRLRG